MAFSRRAQSLLTIFKALVGQKATQRWQSTHFLSSLTICFAAGSKEWTPFGHCFSQMRQFVQRAGLRTTSNSGYRYAISIKRHLPSLSQ